MPVATLDSSRIAALTELGQQLRVDAVRAAAAAGSGHPTSAMSAADLMAVLLANHLHYDFAASRNPGNDHLIFSKGHASPLLYAMYVAAGAISDDELLSFREAGSRLEGHPTPQLPWVDVATGSLGQGLPIGVGLALTGRDLDRLGYRVWVLCGDGELAEGSMWEAFEHAGHEELGALTAIVDVNRLGQTGPTRHGWDTAAYARRIAAFGWHTIEIDGHDIGQIDRALAEAETTGAPTAILARTRKGKGVAAVEDAEGAHGKPLPDEADAIAELGGQRSLRIEVAAPSVIAQPRLPEVGRLVLPTYPEGEAVATRTGFGEALTALGGARSDVVVLDGDVGDSTRAGYFRDAHPERFFECYIAEQQLVAAAVGMQVQGWIPYVCTFAAFLSRAADFLRMAAVSGAHLCVVGSHAGVSIGRDGPSQMGLGDVAFFRALWRSTVLCPCDANQAAWLTAAMADRGGISYLRTTRGETPVLYPEGEHFPIGGSKILRSSPGDELTLVAAGVTVPEAITAADRLAEDGIAARVIDLYSVKPVDVATLQQAAADTGCLLTVEDHWPQGGIGDAVAEAVGHSTAVPRLGRLGVLALPGSGSPAEQLQHAGIDAAAIADAARGMLES
ncbi:transketolase [Prauserella marina]|uniref:Transketolase n=1 Tax=Prauserella marina TaxID=530584 RepID=A0A222VX37_9PSEU|nr:transketolase [Prauserella marina]ASR38460.1 transketolase [Prauserella marina]PWV78296.1 transketolase [Prauserella marina]SDC82817.1 transketolase [Prauserella marina]